LNNKEIQEYYATSPAARWLALTSISLCSFLTALTMSSVNVAVPTIAQELQANAVLVSWLPAAFLLSNVIVILPAGKLADIYGRKKIYLIGIIIFIIACSLATQAKTIEWLLFTRVLQGIGSAMTFATGLALIMSVFIVSSRGMALGFANASVYIGISVGPIAGGWVTEAFGWRSIFLFPIPFALIAIALLLVKLKGEWKQDQPDRVDWTGSLIFMIWATTFFIGISILPGTGAVMTILTGIGFLLIFIYHQLHSKTPLVRIKAVMNNHVFSRSLVASVCAYASNFHLIFLLSLYLQFIRGMSPGEAGQVIVLQAITMAIIAPVAGRLSDVFEPRVMATAGCLVMTCGMGLLQFISMDSSIYLIAGSLLILGIGFGLFTSPNNNAALGSVDKSKLSIATALLSLSRLMGNMTGTAMLLTLVSLIIGKAKIEPDQYMALLTVIRWAVSASFLFTLLGAWFSYARGNVLDKDDTDGETK